MSKNYRMTSAIVFSTITVAGLASNLWGQSKQEPAKAAANQLSKDDDQAVREIVAGYEKAWNSHDMKALAKLFREDAEWVNKVGMHWHVRGGEKRASLASGESHWPPVADGGQWG